MSRQATGTESRGEPSHADREARAERHRAGVPPKRWVTPPRTAGGHRRQPAESQPVRPIAQERGNRCALGELLSRRRSSRRHHATPWQVIPCNPTRPTSHRPRPDGGRDCENVARHTDRPDRPPKSPMICPHRRRVANPLTAHRVSPDLPRHHHHAAHRVTAHTHPKPQANAHRTQHTSADSRSAARRFPSPHRHHAGMGGRRGGAGRRAQFVK